MGRLLRAQLACKEFAYLPFIKWLQAQFNRRIAECLGNDGPSSCGLPIFGATREDEPINSRLLKLGKNLVDNATLGKGRRLIERINEDTCITLEERACIGSIYESPSAQASHATFREFFE